MAPFNKQIPVASPAAYNPTVPMVDADTSRGTMIKGLTSAFKNLVQGADTLIKEKIDTDLTRAYDKTQSDFGVPQMADAMNARTQGIVQDNIPLDQALPGGRPTAPGGAPEASAPATAGQPGAPMSLAPPGAPTVVPEGAPKPAGVASAEQQAATLRSAYQMGGIPEAYYWARMNSILRSVRANYPGYRDYIDSKFSQLLGEPTANHVRQQLIDQLGKESPEAKQYRELVNKAAFNGTLPVDFYKRKQQGNPYTYDELMSHVGSKERDKFDMEQRQREVAAANSNGKLTHEQAVISYRADAQQYVRNALSDMSLAAGKAWHDLQSNLPKWNEEVAKNQGLSGEEQNHARLLLNQIRTGLEQRLAMLATQQLGSGHDPRNRYGSILTSDEIADANKTAMAAVKVLETAILGKDGKGVGLVTAIKTYLDANKDAATRAILRNVPQIQTWQVLSGLVGGQMAALLIAMNPKLQNKVVESFIQTDWGKAWMNGDKGASVTDDMIKAHKVLTKDQSQQYNDAALKTWSTTAQAIAAGKITGDLARNAVSYVFGPKNFELLSKMDPEARRRYFLGMAGPNSEAAMEALKKAGDTRSWETYKAWVLNGFQALARADVNALRGFNMDKTGYKITWDPKANRFFADKVGQPESGGQLFGAPAAAQATEAITRLNELIGTVSPLIKADGMDPGQELNRWFKAMGLQSQAGPGMNSMASHMAAAVDQTSPIEKPGGPSPFDLGSQSRTGSRMAFSGDIEALHHRINSVSFQDFKHMTPEQQFSFLSDAVSPPKPPTKGFSLGADGVRDETKSMGIGYKWGTMRKPAAIIMHHTGGRDTLSQVEHTLKSRHLGAQFFIDRGGRIYQLLPDGAVGRQILHSWGKVAGRSLSNHNTIGIEVAAKDNKDVTPEQVQAGVKLAKILEKKYGIDPTQVFGHGEVNPGHKQPDEGMAIVNALRESSVASNDTLTLSPKAKSAPETADQIAKDSRFNTKLSPAEETKFETWKKKYAPNDSGYDYDLRGAFKAGLKPAANGHWPDTFKKPNHPSFSDQSKYATGKFKAAAGHWEGDTFIPPENETPDRTQWRIKEEPGLKVQNAR